VAVREQEDQERGRGDDDREPVRLFERLEEVPDLWLAGMDQIGAERIQDRREPEEQPDPLHQPADRVVGPARREHVADDRERHEREDEAEVAELAPRILRPDDRVEDLEQDADGEPDQRQAEGHPCEDEPSIPARIAHRGHFARHGQDVRTLSVDAQGGWLFSCERACIPRVRLPSDDLQKRVSALGDVIAAPARGLAHRSRGYLLA
jgi:hypothetical protein